MSGATITDMIKEVTFKKTTYNSPPQKFEAGTPNIAGVIGLATAIKYVNKAINNAPKYGKGHGPINHLNSIKIIKKFR